MELYMVQNQRRKAKIFANSLREFDNFKDALEIQLSSGGITKDEYHRKLKEKAAELDL